MDLIGINVAGAEFGGRANPGRHGFDYFFPRPGYFEQWKERGVRMVRFPIKWERLQRELNGELDAEYASLIDDMLEQAAENDVSIILDIHNYARYRGNIIGTDEVPLSAYQDFLARVAERWKDNRGLWGYDIMNEPHSGADKYWPAAAQAGIDGVRQHDMERALLIEGYFWSSSARWPRYNDPLLELEDPADNLIFSAHTYIDKNASGQYKDGPPGDDFDPMIGVRRVEPFVEWLIKHGKRGHIGEFGVPGDDPRWLEGMDNLLAYLQEHCIPITYWAAGPVWGDYSLSIEPRDGVDQPQWAVLEKYVGQGDCTEIGPRPAR
ncbi:glycoside hydrolase family 5 protein [Stutzerimonas tarimensis]|uniref:Glycoside hydrolase family 5 protein n=1 Tax=Stutzerimonas tarimensis TaxID=1507735 RepID=A0ABV7T450_9GAMM